MKVCNVTNNNYHYHEGRETKTDCKTIERRQKNIVQVKKNLILILTKLKNQLMNLEVAYSGELNSDTSVGSEILISEAEEVTRDFLE